MQLTLKSALNQTLLPLEIIVADDGSTDGTQKAVKELSQDIPLKYVRQEDRGFRAARIRNKAIAKAKSDYVIMIDGDMVLETHFIEDHVSCAKKMQFTQGSRVLFSKQRSASLLTENEAKISIWDKGIGNRKNLLRSSLLAMLFSRNSTGLTGIRTCNFSFWREDAIKVNGFNEDFEGWGREDSEYAARLMNAGIKRKNIRFKAIAFHLFHPYQDRESLPRNEKLLAKATGNKITRCANGLANHLTGLI